MKRSLQNTLIGLGSFALGLTGFYLYTAAQTDTVTATVTVPATVTIADDAVNFSIANLGPGVVDTSQANDLNVASNSASGFNVTVTIADLGATAARLCADSTPDDGSCDASGNVFSTNNGTGSTGSRISVTSNGSGGSLGTLTDATFVGSETNIGSSGVEVFSASDRTNTDTLTILYDAFADYLVAADTYKGTITFTIASQ